MAFKYKRKGSPFWWWSYIDIASGQRRYESMHLTNADRKDTRKAMAMVQQQNLAEMALSGCDKSTAWNAWVPDFINQRWSYGKSESI